jgi:hypothetical protein
MIAACRDHRTKKGLPKAMNKNRSNRLAAFNDLLKE